MISENKSEYSVLRQREADSELSGDRVRLHYVQNSVLISTALLLTGGPRPAQLSRTLEHEQCGEVASTLVH